MNNIFLCVGMCIKYYCLIYLQKLSQSFDPDVFGRKKHSAAQPIFKKKLLKIKKTWKSREIKLTCK